MCEVTVIIPNYNGRQYLSPCLKALYEHTKADMKVIVVDNGSEDGSAVDAKEQYPGAQYVFLDKNYGFCRAVNSGIQKADTPYVLLLNNDTEIKKGFVEHLLRTIKKSKRIFSVEAKMIQYHDQSKIDSAGTFYNALGWAFARGKDKSVEKYTKVSRIFVSCAGAAIYRKEIFDRIGLFDDRHFAYLEDVDVGYRARIYGYRNLYEPQAQVIHVGSAFSGSRYNEFKTRYSARNNVYLIYKNMPFLQIILNIPFLAAGFAVKTIFFFRKGLGRQYVAGLGEGVRMCSRSSKVPFRTENLKNYICIQIELWVNILRRVFVN